MGGRSTGAIIISEILAGIWRQGSSVASPARSSICCNIMPITSACNLGCIFCSHRQNHPAVKTYYFPPLAGEDFEELVPFLASDLKLHLKELLNKNGKPGLVIIPLQIFDRKGFDLLGEHYLDLKNYFPRLSFSFL